MFYVDLKVYGIFQSTEGEEWIYQKDVFDGLMIHDPTEVVRLFHRIPDNSEMSVYDVLHGYSYRFSKGELLKSEEDSDIDLFPWNYV